MNTQHRSIRQNLTNMSPLRAIEYIKAFELPADEEYFLIQCDVRRQSVYKASAEYGLSEDAAKKIRRKAYAHIADDINSRRTG